MLSDYLNAYKLNRPNEILTIPKPLERGKITGKDLIKSITANEWAEVIKKWADGVYHSWSLSHSIVSQIADGFLDNIYKGKIQDRKTTNR